MTELEAALGELVSALEALSVPYAFVKGSTCVARTNSTGFFGRG